MDNIRQIRKRDGRVVAFERRKIADAIFRAAQSVGGEDRFLADQLAGVVVARIAQRTSGVPCIEEVQDAVEKVLIEAGHARTAKTYILYRERRHQARSRRRPDTDPAPSILVGGETALRVTRARTSVREATAPAREADGPNRDGPDRAGPDDDPLDARDPDARDPDARNPDARSLDGGAVTPLRRFSKAHLAQALVQADGLPLEEAEDVAREVESRLVAAGFARVSNQVVTTLARAALFQRGVLSRLASPDDVRAPLGVADEALQGALADLRARDPATVAAGLGESVLAQHLLRHVLPLPVSDAHRLGDLHVYDLGAPLRLTAISLDATTVAAPFLSGSQFSLGSGPARASAALQETVLRYAPFAARLLTMEHVNVFLAPYLARLSDAALGEAVRGLLLAPALGAYRDRGGRLGVEWTLSPDVPRRLQLAAVPDPGLPGTSLGDHQDDALRIARSMLCELAALRRHGHWSRVRFSIVLARGRDWDAATRALLRDALRCAAEGGEPRFLFDDADDPSRGGRFLRRRVAQLPDPLRFERGDVSVGSAVAVNLVAAALRARESGEDAFLRECERLAGLALDAAVTRRDLLDAVGEHPGEALYPLRRGHHPLVDIEGAFHLVEWVGVDAAVALLLPGGSSKTREALRKRVLRQADEALQRLAAPQALCVQSVEALEPDAAHRFARADAERFPDTAGWWADDTVPSYRRNQPGWVEPIAYESGRAGPVARRLRHRVPADRPLDPKDLMDVLRAAARDASVREVVFDPWPRRMVRRTPASSQARPQRAGGHSMGTPQDSQQ